MAKYQDPTQYDNKITLIEFDRLGNEHGNNYLTYVEWIDRWGDLHYGSAINLAKPIPDEIRFQVAMQIAGDLLAKQN